MGRGSTPPPIFVPMPLATLLAFPGLAWLSSLLVGEGYELHELIGATTFTRQPYIVLSFR